MHKVFLTEEECSIIHGAQDIIKVLGGFPSMEDGELESIEIKHRPDSGRYDISLLFDISGWIKVCKFNAEACTKLYPYPDAKEIPSTKIRINFDCAEGFAIENVDMRSCGEIKFTNNPLRKSIVQDCHPSAISKVSRPFCGFGIRRGEDFFISFIEEEIIISAHFE